MSAVRTAAAPSLSDQKTHTLPSELPFTTVSFQPFVGDGRYLQTSEWLDIQRKTPVPVMDAQKIVYWMTMDEFNRYQEIVQRGAVSAEFVLEKVDDRYLIRHVKAINSNVTAATGSK